MENDIVVKNVIVEVIIEDFKLIMIRLEYVVLVKEMILKVNLNLNVGIVIDFLEGKLDLEIKIKEVNEVIINGVDDLDFVCNYEVFKDGNIELVK